MIPVRRSPALGEGESLTGLDVVLERAYRRFGWRLLLVHTALTWLCGLVAGVAVALLFLRIARASLSEALAVSSVIVLLAIACAALGLWFTRGLVRPLSDWFDGGRDPAPGAEVWSTVHALPVQISVRNASLAGLVLPGVATAAIADVAPVDASFVGLVVLFTAVGVATTAVLGIYGFQLVLRPLIRDAARTLAVPPPPHGGTSLRAKLLIAMPVLAVFLAMSAVLATIEPGTDWSTALVRELLVSLICLVVVGPASAMLVRSTLEPMDDLMQATARLADGDFATRVPELSGDEYGALAESFNAAMKGLAERERLAAANAKLLDEVRASRARIIAASDAERRRVERNLHDGAQQRLIALALDLQIVRDMADTGDVGGIKATAAEAAASLETALDELRELARGLHPPVLSTDGLAFALDTLAVRAPVPVTVEAPDERYPDEVESTAYFVASEALANMAKYAHASRATVSVKRRNGRLVVAVSDDGIGGADAHTGSGLAGLADRVAALDGSLIVSSPAGGGTTVTAELPLASGTSP